LLGLLIAGLAFSIVQRTPLRAELIRDRNVLYRELSDGQVENVYSLKLINMDRRTHQYRITVAGNPAVAASTNRPLVLGPEQVGTFSLRLTAPADAGQGVQRLEIRFEAEDDPAIARSTSARLILPGGDQ
jgi:polyferredoxin